MRRILASGFVRGLALIAAVSLAIVLLSLEESLVTAGALVRVAFFLALAFFAFLVWRERRGELETWADLSRRTFYAAVGLAVLDVAALLALDPSGQEAVVFAVVLLACGYAVVRVWQRERRLV